MVGKFYKILLFILLFFSISCSSRRQFLVISNGTNVKFKRVNFYSNSIEEKRFYFPKKEYYFIPNSDIYKTNDDEVKKIILEIFKFTQSKNNQKNLLDIKIKIRNDSIKEYLFLFPIFHSKHIYSYNKKSNIFKYEYISGEF